MEQDMRILPKGWPSQMAFEDELRGLLKKYRVEYDERYIWR